MRFQLPNGIIDGADYFNYVMIDELRGKQQNYLADKNLVVGNVGHVPKIVTDLVKSIETKEGLAWKGNMSELCWKLTASDIEAILVRIREETYGPEFYHEAICEKCEKHHKNMKLNLSDLDITSISLNDLTDASKRTIVLPKSKLEVELKPLYLRDVFEVIKITTSKSDRFITALSALTMKRLGDKSPVTEQDIEDLPARDLTHLGKVTENLKASNKDSDIVLEGFIDTTIEYSCSNCGHENEMSLNVFDPDFFDPSKASQS